MRTRDLWLVLLGAAFGVVAARLAAGERTGGPIQAPEPSGIPRTSSEPPVGGSPVAPPSPGEAPPTEAPDPVAGPGASALAMKALSLELEMHRIHLDARGVPRPTARTGYAGNPHAGRTTGEMAEDREKAEREVLPLLEKWRAARPGAERASAMKDLSVPMFHLLETGGSMENLLVLEESAERGETAEERRLAVITAHRLWQAPVVDFLQARAQSPHREVRLFAVEGLAWVRGAEADRAREGLIRGLTDPDPGVRGMAATSIGVIVADPSLAETILENLGRETDRMAAMSMALAILELDPAQGKARVERAMAGVSEEVRAAVQKALTAEK